MDLEQFITKTTDAIIEGNKELEPLPGDTNKLIGLAMINNLELMVEFAQSLQTEFKRLREK